MDSFFPMELKLSNGNVLYFTRYVSFDGHQLVIYDKCIKWFTSSGHVIFKSWDDCVDYMKLFDMRGFTVRIDYGSYFELNSMEMKNIGLQTSLKEYPKYPFTYELVFTIEFEELENLTKTVFVMSANDVKTRVKLDIN
jgi:hypothetical protein